MAIFGFRHVAITGLEVFLAYEELQHRLMLAILVSLSVVKAAMIMSYFMHLKFEKFSLVLWLIPAMVFCLCMMLIFFLSGSLSSASNEATRRVEDVRSTGYLQNLERVAGCA